MSRSCDDTSTKALIAAASALHDAANALTICARMLPREAPPPGSGRFDTTAPTIVDPVQEHIRQALDAIAAEIGEDAMLSA